MEHVLKVDEVAPDQPSARQIVLVLSGGNALGAYHAGVYEALAEADLEPDWVVGASIGAIVGAIIAGNRREHRMARLRQFWRPAPENTTAPWDMWPETWRRTSAVLETALYGRGGLFGALGSLNPWSRHLTEPGSRALYDTWPMRMGLSDIIDFDLLNNGPMRFMATAVDVETGEDVFLDTRSQVIGVDHLRASAALLPTFPAVEIEGRLLGDGGLSMNLPLDPVANSPSCAPVLCIASDLLPLRSGPPKTLGEVTGRAQDLIFAAQSRRTIAYWQRLLAAGSDTCAAPVTLLKIAYSGQEREVAGKAMDFSPRTVRERWNRGKRDAARALAAVPQSQPSHQGAGLTVIEG